jgi:hypothetical protein
MLLGCGQTEPAAPKPKGPSYAEALSIYNQELELLERLKASATAAQTAHDEKVARLKSALALGALGDAAGDLSGVVNDLAAAGSLLDEESAAKAKAASDKARNQLTDASSKATAEIEAAVKQHEAQMTKLNKDIAEQEEKVAKAKQVKDAAEKRQ